MIKKIQIFLILLFLVGCKDKINYEKPDNLISKEKMVDILYDMHLVVGTSNIKNTHLEKNRNYMSLVYEKYGIDSVSFAESNLYYTSEINEYEEIFEEVERRIVALQAIMEPDTLTMDKLKATDSYRKKDSIERILN